MHGVIKLKYRWSTLMEERTLFSLALSLFFCGSLGCADHPVAELQAAADALNEELCRCPEFGTTDTCTMPFRATEAEEACVRRVYDEYEDEIQPFYDCALRRSRPVSRVRSACPLRNRRGDGLPECRQFLVRGVPIDNACRRRSLRRLPDRVAKT